MKKLLTLGLFSILLMSCNNNGNGELLEDSVNQTHQIQMKASARESGSVSLEDAISSTLEDDNLVAINEETLQLVHRGQLLKESEFENNIVTNPSMERKTKTVCSAVNPKGYTISIVHVYDDHYSGYELVSTNPKGISYSSSINYFPTDCIAIWSNGWF